MTATGIFADAQSTVVTTLTGLGLKVVTDVRNARPLTVLVDPPTFTAFNSNIADIEIELKVLAAPPANQDQIDYLITTADTIMNSALSLIRGIPGVMQIGGQEVPTYDLTVQSLNNEELNSHGDYDLSFTAWRTHRGHCGPARSGQRESHLRSATSRSPAPRSETPGSVWSADFRLSRAPLRST
jgi:hypothetical protein